ncbi:MAG: biotin--[acetyl-CoA-carboxylase] ligase [Candidatus Electrothrix sp. YB6]
MQEHLYCHFQAVDSTNTLAVRLAEQGAEHGTVIHADCQTGGRGRGGRRFVSPAGGLYFSLILRPEIDLCALPLITLAAGTALCSCLRAAADVPVQIKWPNDLYLQDRKLAGILTESGPIRHGRTDFVVIGAGINVTTAPEQFPADLRQKSTSLAAVAARCPEREKLLPLLVDALCAAVRRLRDDNDKDALLAEWRSFDYLRKRPLQYVCHDTVIPATGVGLADDGLYRILDAQGKEHRIPAGDLNPIRLPLWRNVIKEMGTA